MQIELNLEDLQVQGFAVKTRVIQNETLRLIYPTKIGVRWCRENMIFRSSMWTESGKLCSASWKKFTNLGEAPESFPDPTSLHEATVVEKIDGTCLIVSKYKGELIARTRGTVDIITQNNGHELEFLKKRYPLAFNNSILNSEEITLLFEYTTPSNIIVLDYGTMPNITLIGAIVHKDYSYKPQKWLDAVAPDLGVPRPKTISVKELYKLVDDTKKAVGIEGYCVYYHDDQEIKKIKSEDYLLKHRFKSDYCIERVIDLFLKAGMPHFMDFQHYLVQEFDYECMMKANGDASKVCDAYRTVKRITDHMEEFVSHLDGKERASRKEAAASIISAYGQTNRSAYAFKLLNGEKLAQDDLKKLIFQCLN